MAIGYEERYKIGKYLEPRPGREGTVEKLLMTAFALDRADERPNFGFAPSIHVDFIRVQIHDLLHAFKSPSAATIVSMSNIGCTGITEDGEAACKVWVLCPEDIESPKHTHTIVLEDVRLPLESVRVREGK